ncbi:MAG: PD-(D/E)XK motif protein [Gemmatimonadetes bacterium]|nr:PD-(D/E)XK motif protein [Gemmatimonadota bacterium]
MQRQFYHFAVAVSGKDSERWPLGDRSGHAGTQCFSHLFEQTPLLSTERQIGLLGELLFLERLMSRIGSDAVDAWMGPLAEPHDFRVGSREYEIKTTTASHRVHTVHGTEQLVPSLGCSLSVISILVGPPGTAKARHCQKKLNSWRTQFGIIRRKLSDFRGTWKAPDYDRPRSSSTLADLSSGDRSVSSMSMMLVRRSREVSSTER